MDEKNQSVPFIHFHTGAPMTNINVNSGTAPPFGFNRAGEKDKEEQDVLKIITKLRYEDNLSVFRITEHLVSLGFHNRRGDVINEDNVYHIIRNIIAPSRNEYQVEERQKYGNNPPYGFAWSGTRDKVANPYEQEILHKVSELRKSGISFRKIAQALSNQGYTNRFGRSISTENVTYWYRNCIMPTPESA